MSKYSDKYKDKPSYKGDKDPEKDRLDIEDKGFKNFVREELGDYYIPGNEVNFNEEEYLKSEEYQDWKKKSEKWNKEERTPWEEAEEKLEKMYKDYNGGKYIEAEDLPDITEDTKDADWYDEQVRILKEKVKNGDK